MEENKELTDYDKMSDEELRAKLKADFKEKRDKENAEAEEKFRQGEDPSLQKVVTVADYNAHIITTFKEAYLQGMVAGLYLAKIDPIEIGKIMGEKVNFVQKAIKFFTSVMAKLIILGKQTEVKDSKPEVTEECKDDQNTDQKNWSEEEKNGQSKENL